MNAPKKDESSRSANQEPSETAHHHEGSSSTTLQPESDWNRGSRQVRWFSVYEYTQPLLSKVGSWPIAGTAAWMRLPDDDPAKLAAVLDAGRQQALRNDTEQTAMAEASHDVAASADWPAIAREHLRRYTTRAYIPREEVA